MNMLRQITRKTLSTVFYSKSRLKKRCGIVVLMYHRVNNVLIPNDLIVSTKTFRQQMEYLHKNKYRVIGIEEMITILSGTVSRPLDDRHPALSDGLVSRLLREDSSCVVITFDDGYRDNYLDAYPILKEFKFPAAIFLTAEMIGTDKKRPRYEKMPAPDMLRWEEVKEMAHNGIEFGAHTVSHPRLNRISLEDAMKEIEESKKMIAERAGLEAKTFCYPYGKYTPQVKQLVRDAGFACAFTVKPGINKPGCDLFELKRTGMNGLDSLFDFRKKLAGAYDSLHKLMQSTSNR